MYKLIIMNVLFGVLLLGCQKAEKFTMEMPETKPPLFQIQRGLDPELTEEQVVFEKYSQTRLRTASAIKLYANGDCYRIYLDPNGGLKYGKASWEKVGVISQNKLKDIENISNTSVVDFIKKGPHEVVAGAAENVNWYFYFDEPKFVESQQRQWQLSGEPKFVKKMNKILQELKDH